MFRVEENAEAAQAVPQPLGVARGRLGLVRVQGAQLRVDLLAVVLALQKFKDVESETAAGAVGLGDIGHGLDGLGVVAAVDEELGRLLTSKDEGAHEEDEERDGAEGEEQVPPAHVCGARATGLAGVGGATRGERRGLGKVGRAGVRGDEGVGQGAADDDAGGLEDGQTGEKEAPALLDGVSRA